MLLCACRICPLRSACWRSATKEGGPPAKEHGPGWVGRSRKQVLGFLTVEPERAMAVSSANHRAAAPAAMPNRENIDEEPYGGIVSPRRAEARRQARSVITFRHARHATEGLHSMRCTHIQEYLTIHSRSFHIDWTSTQYGLRRDHCTLINGEERSSLHWPLSCPHMTNVLHSSI